MLIFLSMLLLEFINMCKHDNLLQASQILDSTDLSSYKFLA